MCNSCKMDTRALPDMHAQLSEGFRPEGRGHTYQAKPECPVLQLICNTYQADIQGSQLPKPVREQPLEVLYTHT